jgi:hypothetical protein
MIHPFGIPKEGNVMFRRRAMPISALIMILILALATLGIGYGLWSKTLIIEGTVNTGKVDAEFSYNEVDEGVWRPFNQNNQDDDEEYEGKDVAECTMEVAGDKLTITITKGYPSFHCWAEFDVHNTGTIPIKLHLPEFKDVPPWLTLNLDDSSIPYGCYHDTYFNPVGVHPQLHPSDRVFCVIFMHIEQSAPQDATATFTGSIFAHQWNEEPTP